MEKSNLLKFESYEWIKFMIGKILSLDGLTQIEHELAGFGFKGGAGVNWGKK